MSQENVESVRRTHAAFNRRDWDMVSEGLDREIEWHQIMPFPDRAVYRGRQERRGWAYGGAPPRQTRGGSATETPPGRRM
jgi:ketosteroid isomerase-like protein